MNFCISLKLSGLRQEDIYSTVMQTLKETKDPRDREFNTLFMPMLINMMYLDMKPLTTEWETVVGEAYKDSDKSMNEMIAGANRNQRIEYMNQILGAGMENESPYFNDLKDSLINNTNGLQNMEKYRMNEIVEACKQSDIDFSPDYDQRN